MIGLRLGRESQGLKPGMAFPSQALPGCGGKAFSNMRGGFPELGVPFQGGSRIIKSITVFGGLLGSPTMLKLFLRGGFRGVVSVGLV